MTDQDALDTLPLSPELNAALAKDRDFEARCVELARHHSRCDTCGVVVKAKDSSFWDPVAQKLYHAECRPTRR